MDLGFLKEIDEWGAVGFYEAEGLPHPRRYGMAVRRLYEHMRVRVRTDCYLTPCEVVYCGMDAEDGRHHNLAFILNPFHSTGMEVSRRIAEKKKKQFPQYADMIDESVADMSNYFGRRLYTHSNPDAARILSEGFDAVKRELDASLDAAVAEGDAEGENLLLALKDAAAGIDAYFGRTAEALNAAASEYGGDWVTIADEFAHCFYRPARSFVGGLLALNFLWKLDGCDSIGSPDRLLGDLFERDLASGRLTLEFARTLLDQLFRNFERMNAWNMQLGGRRADGKDGCNRLTEELLLCQARNRLIRPNLALRINRDTPERVVELAMESIATGNGKPALYNDDLYIELLMKNFPSLTYADAVCYGFGGCTETMICGLSAVDSLAGNINLAKALELALFDGFDLVTGEQRGPHTGRFEDFSGYDAFVEAVKTQIRFLTDGFVDFACRECERYKTWGDPKIMRSLFTRDCISNRRSFEAGGARYNWSVVSYDGTTVLIDSLTAIRTLVFEQKRVAAADLVFALRRDFKGDDDLLGALKRAGKFGNDVPADDEEGARILRFAWEELSARRTPRGNGRFVPSIIEFETYDGAGLHVAATPDGRNALAPLNDSVGAMAGCDANGPTALINSVLRLPLELAFGTPVLNLRFHGALFDTAENRKKIFALIGSYFDRGGLQIQISVLDRDKLLDAQRDPDKYRDLIVRIGGYSAYFVKLTKALQDTVIARTEHSL